MLALVLAGPTGGADHATRLVPYGPGGRFGGNLSPKLSHAFGGSGRILLLVFGLLVSLMLATEYLLSTLILRAFDWVEQFWGRLRAPTPAMAGVGSVEPDAPIERDPSEPRGFAAVVQRIRETWFRRTTAIEAVPEDSAPVSGLAALSLIHI